MAAALRRQSIADTPQRRLSPRLQQVQALLQRGAANKVIARELGLSDHTVKEYVSSVLAYHGVANRLELVLRLGAERPNG
jgi:DNA-binding NarL/FixJ family response regulator